MSWAGFLPQDVRFARRSICRSDTPIADDGDWAFPQRLAEQLLGVTARDDCVQKQLPMRSKVPQHVPNNGAGG